MKNLTSYIFITECVLSLAKSLKGSLILYDGYEYYVDAEVFKYCIQGSPKNMDEFIIFKILCSLIHGVTEQDKVTLLTSNGDIVGTLLWDEETEKYEQKE